MLHEASKSPTNEWAKAPRTLKLRASQSRVYRESQMDHCSLSSSLRRERESRTETERRNEERRKRVTDRETVCRHGRFDGTHGSVLKVHTTLFAAREQRKETTPTDRHTHTPLRPRGRSTTPHNITQHQQHHTLPLSLRREIERSERHL